MASPKIRSFAEQKQRAEKQLAVLIVLVSIPLTFILFLRGPVTTYLDNRDRVAVAEAESAVPQQLIRADEKTSEAVRIASSRLDGADFRARIDEAARAAGVDLGSVEVKGTQANVEFRSDDHTALARFGSELSSSVRFTAEGQIRADAPLIMTSSVSTEKEDGEADYAFKLTLRAAG